MREQEKRAAQVLATEQRQRQETVARLEQEREALVRVDFVWGCVDVGVAAVVGIAVGIAVGATVDADANGNRTCVLQWIRRRCMRAVVWAVLMCSFD